MGDARVIRLRRPAMLAPLEEPFVPDGGAGLLDEIDRRWRALCEGNPAYFDGRVYHVLGVHRNGHGGAVLHVADCAYRFFAVQEDDFDLGVRPIGVKGITVRGPHVLFGRRAANVAGYPGRWEFAPGGALEPGRPPTQALLAELAEETGVTAAREPTALAIMFDPVIRTWELVFRIESGPAAHDRAPPTDEYDRLEWRRDDDPPGALTPLAERMVALV